MKNLTILAMAALCLSAQAKVKGEIKPIIKGTMTDPRNNITYNTIKVSGKTWMAENLDYAYGSSYCYEFKQENCDKYGHLYDWESAKKVCPKGWHLPSDEEWSELSGALGSKGLADASWYGDNSSGFGALPAGYRIADGSFYSLGSSALFWSSTPSGESDAWYRYLGEDNAEFKRFNHFRSRALSVRCLQD